MLMERHRCKVCSKSFLNGRALGGHMRSHLATLPLPPRKKLQEHDEKFQLGDRTESDSSSTRSDDEMKVGFYELRENPKKSVKASDPEFLDAGSVVVQDRESETESTQNPTRRRSKRGGQMGRGTPKKCKWVGSESPTESTPVSSVSDPSQDEEVALCLMMLSRDAWERVVVKHEKSIDDTHDSAAELKTPTTPIPTRPSTRTAKFKCLQCKKVFRTGRALAGHKASNRQCCQENSENGIDHSGQKIFECPFCYKVFGSGQALGGHKRSHLLGSSATNNNNINNNSTTVNNVASNNTTTTTSNVNSNADKVGDTTSSFILDLNLPAPVEDDDEDDDQEHTASAPRFSTFSSTTTTPRVGVE